MKLELLNQVKLEVFKFQQRTFVASTILSLWLLSYIEVIFTCCYCWRTLRSISHVEKAGDDYNDEL